MQLSGCHCDCVQSGGVWEETASLGSKSLQSEEVSATQEVLGAALCYSVGRDWGPGGKHSGGHPLPRGESPSPALLLPMGPCPFP